MFSVNPIAGFFSQLYLQNESVKKPNLLHVDTNSNKSKVDQKGFAYAWSKIGAVWLWDSKIDCILRMN